MTGTVSPLPCGNPFAYCPASSSLPVLPSPGFNASGGATAFTHDTQVPCQAGQIPLTLLHCLCFACRIQLFWRPCCELSARLVFDRGPFRVQAMSSWRLLVFLNRRAVFRVKLVAMRLKTRLKLAFCVLLVNTAHSRANRFVGHANQASTAPRLAQQTARAAKPELQARLWPRKAAPLAKPVTFLFVHTIVRLLANTGSFSATASATTCRLCPAGFSQGSGSQSFCAICSGVGQFSSSPGAAVCSICTTGIVSSNRTLCLSVNCPAGTQGLADGSCQPCIIGTFAPQGSTHCSVCAVNTYTSRPGAAVCTICSDAGLNW